MRRNTPRATVRKGRGGGLDHDQSATKVPELGGWRRQRTERQGTPPMIELAKRYAASVPRYTSYPTALNFNDRVGAPQARTWLRALPEGSHLSLYFHFP